MNCKGCGRPIGPHMGETVTWPNGKERGVFCLTCRQWIHKGHRNVPVVYVASETIQHDGLNRRTRYYRNDSTGSWYSLTRDISSPGAPYFVAYGPAPSKGSTENVSVEIAFNGHHLWGADFSWTKAERVFFKRIADTP